MELTMSDQNNNNEPPMSQEDKKYALDHEYDGIKELNYPLPGWWKATFYGGILAGIVYFIYYQLMGGPSLKDEFLKDLKHHTKIQESYLEKVSEFDFEKYDAFNSSPDMISLGKQTFVQNCQGCHNQNGAGDIGPNLTDQYWIYAEGTPETIYPFIISGSPATGMPQWGNYLQPDDIYAVVAYVMSIQGFEHSIKVKDPQGDLYEVESESESESESE
jgi:cytochrome c oxidase cbb3-type subunit 3